MLNEQNTAELMVAGKNAVQMQGVSSAVVVNNYYQNSNITEADVQRIANELVGRLEPVVLEEIHKLWQAKASKLNSIVISKTSRDNTLGAFEDPGFLRVLYKAYQTVSLSTRELDFEMLSDILAQRAANPGISETKIATEKAAEILNDVSDEALRGLAAYYIMYHILPGNGMIQKGLDHYASIFASLEPESLPMGRSWLTQLDLLDAVTISPISIDARPFETFLSNVFAGYSVRGIKENSPEHQEALQELQNAGIPTTILVAHEFNPGYMRLALATPFALENESILLPLNDKQGIDFTLDEKKRDVLKSIYKKTNNPEKPVAEANLIAENWRKAILDRAPLRTCQNWWAQINTAVRVNTTGYVLGYIFARQKIKGLPDWQ